MDIGFIGLGKMGMNMVTRLTQGASQAFTHFGLITAACNLDLALNTKRAVHTVARRDRPSS